MAGLAVVFGSILAIAFRYLKVEEDPRIDQLEEMLPGNNCGACGSPGCRAFAEGLTVGSFRPAQCTVSSSDNIDRIAHFLGVDAGSIVKQVARLHCAGGKGLVKELAQYRGMTTCRGAVIVNGGGRACVYGCLGLADCERACSFGAIRMNTAGLPVVDTDLCTACGDCVDVCPLHLFHLEPLAQKLVVQCSSPLTGSLATSICAVACDACGRCVSDAEPGVLEMVSGLPVIRKADETQVNATYRCPTGAIQWVAKDQFPV
ncbi:MAG: RnfABCDGE type electron transport complex subunit B [Acidobacteria bacterium]|nr:RnfABCDGE type electron transport complex subunit B [Acidobacteriota bacterium]MCB9398021.1 RnfABCDGE type electron transport complex subunit B [Acidobacteriota bacterium]